jgi:hypothetical protein
MNLTFAEHSVTPPISLPNFLSNHVRLTKFLLQGCISHLVDQPVRTRTQRNWVIVGIGAQGVFGKIQEHGNRCSELHDGGDGFQSNVRSEYLSLIIYDVVYFENIISGESSRFVF